MAAGAGAPDVFSSIIGVCIMNSDIGVGRALFSLLLKTFRHCCRFITFQSFGDHWCLWSVCWGFCHKPSSTSKRSYILYWCNNFLDYSVVR